MITAEPKLAAMEKSRIIEMHQPRWTSAWIWLVLLAAFFIAEGALALSVIQGWMMVQVVLVLVIAHIMHTHLIAFHEAAHGTLCPNRYLNDSFGVFIGVMSFMCFSLYRAAHYYHHAYLATERDEELWPFVDPRTPRWQRWIAAACELVLGLAFTPFLFLRTFLRKGTPIKDPKVRLRIWGELGLLACLWLTAIAVTAWFGAWNFLLTLYLAPALLAGFMQSLRKYIEHMGLTGATVLESTRSVVSPGPVGRLLSFTLFNEPYHGVHHKFARMPQSALPEFVSVLTPATPEEIPPFPSYRKAVADMIRSLRDPRVGAQWRAQNGESKPEKLQEVEFSSPENLLTAPIREMA